MKTIYEYWQSCLLKGTRIMLANRTEKKIEDITYEDELLVWNFDEGKLDTAKPLWIKKAEKSDYFFRNVLGNWRELLTTGQSDTGWGHRMFDIDKGKFVYTTESVSDMIHTLDGSARHMSCQRIETECEYYNIVTDKHFNLFANRILTSCSLNNLYPIVDMRFVKTGEIPHQKSDFDLPDRYIEGLRLCENPASVESLTKYVKKMIAKEK